MKHLRRRIKNLLAILVSPAMFIESLGAGQMSPRETIVKSIFAMLIAVHLLYEDPPPRPPRLPAGSDVPTVPATPLPPAV